MAGIGFKLRFYAEEGTYSGILKGYTYSAIISAGPWLLSALALGALAFLSRGEMGLYHGTLMYVFSFTLLYTGFFQFVVTRFLADKLYGGDIDRHVPTFLGTLLLTLVPQAYLVLGFLGTLQAPTPFRFVAYSCTLAVSSVWIIMIFLGVVRAYHWAVFSFLAGGCVTVGSGWLLGRFWGQTGYLSGFLAGQLVTLALLVWLFLSEFPWKKAMDFSFLSYFRKFPSLCLIGFLYYLSSWVDKFVYRASPHGVLIAPRFLFAAPDYEVASFLAQLTTVPALAIFFLRVETDFYERYRDFFAAIAQHQTFAAIDSCRELIIRSVREGFWFLLRFQGILTLTLFLMAPQVFRLIWLNAPEINLLRFMILGNFFQTLLFLSMILMLYFEFYGDALLACAVFLAANWGLSLAALEFLPQAPGAGFTLAAVIGFAFTAWRFLTKLQRLTELLFSNQPVLPAAAGDPRVAHRDGFGLQHPVPGGSKC